MGRLTQHHTHVLQPGAESHTRAGTHPPPTCPERHSLATRASARRCRVKNKPVLPAHCCTTSCQGREPGAGQQDTHCRKQDLRGGPQPAGRGKPASRPEPQLRLQKPPRAWKPTFSRDNLRSASCLTASGPTRLPSFAGWLCGVGRAEAPRPQQEGRRMWEAAEPQAAPAPRGRAARGRAQPCGPASGISTDLASGTGRWHAARGSGVPRARGAPSRPGFSGAARPRAASHATPLRPHARRLRTRSRPAGRVGRAP